MEYVCPKGINVIVDSGCWEDVLSKCTSLSPCHPSEMVGMIGSLVIRAECGWMMRAEAEQRRNKSVRSDLEGCNMGLMVHSILNYLKSLNNGNLLHYDRFRFRGTRGKGPLLN